MPTSKVIRPAVFDETGEHVIPADADLNLDPVSSDPDNYIVRGSDGGAFLNGDGVLSNDGENLLKITPNDGKVTYPRSDAVSLITETVQPFLDTIDGEAASAQIAADNAQAAADKAAESARQADEDAAAAQCTATQALNDAADAKATADNAQAAADKAAEDAAAAQCTATQALNDAADAQADADKAQARADSAYDRASDAQCAAADALDKAKEAVDKLPEIADEHVTVVTAGDGIKVDHTKNFSHNVYQVSVKRNGDDSGLISSTDGLEVELKGNGGLDKDKDGLYVDQQWIDEMVVRYAKDHMLFNQIKVVKQLPEIPDADVHTIYLIRNRDSSATDAGTKDSFDGWIIVTTENGTQKWEEVGYKTDLRGYTHTGNTVKLTGDAAGTGTVDSNGNVVVPTTVSHAAHADHATNADHATSADSATNAGHATNADSATNAGHATNADHATKASSADNASEANHAKVADKLAGGAGGALGGLQWYDAPISPNAAGGVSTVRVAYFSCGNGLYYFSCADKLTIPPVTGVDYISVSLPSGFKHPYVRLINGKPEIAYSTSLSFTWIITDSSGATRFNGFNEILACEVDNA